MQPALFLTKDLERLHLAPFAQLEVTAYLASMWGFALQGRFLSLVRGIHLRVRHALRASFASRGAAVQLAQALALLAAIPLSVQAHQEVAYLALRESTASRDAHPPAAAETALLGVFPLSVRVLRRVAARALPGDTAWRVALAAVPMENARPQRVALVPREHFLLLDPAKMRLARLVPRSA